MPEPIEVIVREKQDGNAIEQAERNLGKLMRASDLAGKQMKNAGMGLDTAFSAAGDAVDVLDKNMAGAIKSATGLVSALAYGGALGLVFTGIGMAVSALVTEMNRASVEAQKMTDEIKKPFEDLKREISSMVELKGMDAMAKQLGVSSGALKDYLGSSKEANAEGLRFVSTNEAMALKQVELTKATDDLRASKAAYTEVLKSSVEGETNPALEAAAQHYQNAQINVDGLRESIRWLSSEQANLNESIQRTINITTKTLSVDAYYDRQKRQQAAFANAAHAEEEKNLKARAAAMENLARAQKDILAGVIGSALTPTAVSAEDARRNDLLARRAELQKQINDLENKPAQKRRVEGELGDIEGQLAGLGAYQDKWDEAARRFDAIAKGTNASEYGKEFAAMFGDLGMSAEEAAERFRNFSLFADPKNLGLVNWGAATLSVEEQLDAMLGKANFDEEAFKQVYDKLPQIKRDALKKMGISKLSDMDKEAIGIRKADDFDAALAGIKNDILTNIPPEMEATVMLTYKTRTDGSGSGDSTGQNTAGANAPGNAGWGGIPMAQGGVGTYTRSGMVTYNVDAGEHFAFSGAPTSRGQNPLASSQPQTIVLKVDGRTLSRVVVGHVAGNQ